MLRCMLVFGLAVTLTVGCSGDDVQSGDGMKLSTDDRQGIIMMMMEVATMMILG